MNDVYKVTIDDEKDPWYNEILNGMILTRSN